MALQGDRKVQNHFAFEKSSTKCKRESAPSIGNCLISLHLKLFICHEFQRLVLTLRLPWAPTVPVQHRYQWSYLYAFACPQTGEGQYWLLPSVNTEAFQAVLERFAASTGAGKTRKIILVLGSVWLKFQSQRMMQATCTAAKNWCPRFS